MTDLMKEFGYLIKKIESAEFSKVPFEHIIIDDFLSDTHFNKITSANEIKRPVFSNTEKLIDDLVLQGYVPQNFPGCTIDVDQYIKSLDSGDWTVDEGLLEGFGMAFRLKKYQTPVLERITQFLNSQEFKSALEKKFKITKSAHIETAIQKYLQAYEISPHPDIRRKAATYMLNINTDLESENIEIHTFLCQFKPEKSYIYDFWEKNKDIDRCWVPWDWCERVFATNSNNSIVLFSPSDKSLHAVKLNYDHLNYQRTQIYGNLWYDETTSVYNKPTYKQLDSSNIDIEKIREESKRKQKSNQTKKAKTIKNFIICKIPTPLKEFIKNKFKS
jgi:hypothetical protein